jgi:hypothetical protein
MWYLKVDGLDPVSVDKECEKVDAQESNHEAQHQAPHQKPHLRHISHNFQSSILFFKSENSN